MKKYLVSIMGKNGIFKKEVAAHRNKVLEGYLCFYEQKEGESAFLIVKEWILVEEMLGEV